MYQKQFLQDALLKFLLEDLSKSKQGRKKIVKAMSLVVESVREGYEISVLESLKVEFGIQ